MMFIMCSCGIFKNSAGPDIKNDIQSSTDISISSDETQNTDSVDSTHVDTKSASDKVFDQMDDMNASWSTSVISYDTNKPIDIATGKPPILSESITTYNSDSHKENKAIDKSKVDVIDNSVKRSNTTKDTKAKTNISTKTKDESSTITKHVPWWKWVLGGVGLSAVAIVVWKTRSLFV